MLMPRMFDPATSAINHLQEAAPSIAEAHFVHVTRKAGGTTSS